MDSSSTTASSTRPSSAPSKRGRIYLRADVAKHNKEGDCWVICNDRIYDVRPSPPPPVLDPSSPRAG